MFFQFDEKNRVCAYSEENCLVDGLEFDMPAEMTADTMQDWLLKGKKLVHDPLPEPEDPTAEMEAAICELYELVIGE
jgi:hypothetical protein